MTDQDPGLVQLGVRSQLLLPVTPKNRRRTSLATALAVTAVVTYLAGVGQSFATDDATGWNRYLLLRLLCCLVAAGFLLFGTFVNRPAHRGPWCLLAVLLLFGWTARPILLLYGWPGNWGGWYFTTYVGVQFITMAGAVIWIVRVRRPRTDTSARLDVGVLTLGYLALQLHVSILPGIHLRPEVAYIVGLGVLAPIGYVAVVVYLARLVFIDVVRGRAFGYLVIAYGSTVLPNIFTVFVQFSGSPWRIAVDTAPLAVFMFAAAAVEPSMTVITARSTANRPDWSFGRCLVLVVLVALPFAAALTGPRPNGVEAVALVVLVVLATALLILRARRAVAAWRDAEQRSRDQALTDPLTGLSNRRGASAFARAMGSRPYGLAFCDLDGFKRLNDVHGYLTGDRVLQAVGRRLQEQTGPGDQVSRLGGDEFAFFFRGGDLAAAGERVIERIATALSSPIIVDGRRIRVTTSVGLAHTGATSLISPPPQLGDWSASSDLEEPSDGPAPRLPLSPATDSADVGRPEPMDDGFLQLLRGADLALHVAKLAGGNRAVRFEADLERDALREMRIAESLGNAVDHQLLAVHYQGIVDLRTGVVAGAEALMRLSIPGLGMISPVEFIPLAERNGRIMELGDWIFGSATGELATALGRLPSGFRLSINVSPIQLASEAFVRRLESLPGTMPSLVGSICVEVTESAVAGAEARSALVRIADAGLQVAVDDFGADYASLQYLTQLPVEKLKLDRSFVSRLLDHAADRAVVRHVLHLAADLNIAVVAEGVEESRQAQLLAEYGCPYGQGFLWDRPAPGLERFGLEGTVGIGAGRGVGRGDDR